MSCWTDVLFLFYHVRWLRLISANGFMLAKEYYSFLYTLRTFAINSRSRIYSKVPKLLTQYKITHNALHFQTWTNAGISWTKGYAPGEALNTIRRTHLTNIVYVLNQYQALQLFTVSLWMMLLPVNSCKSEEKKGKVI